MATCSRAFKNGAQQLLILHDPGFPKPCAHGLDLFIKDVPAGRLFYLYNFNLSSL
jgi:hypothetical protein